MSRLALASIAMFPVALLSLTGCPSENNVACPPGQFYDQNSGQCFGQQPSCPPGQTWNGMQCAAGVGTAPTCPAGQTWNGSACVAGAGGGFPANPFGIGGSCPPAQPADAMTASAAGPGLSLLAQQYAPGATAVGGVAAGNFQTGQCVEVAVTLNPGKCYTAIGTGAGPTEVDVMLTPGIPMAPPIAQDNTSGTMAVLGGTPNCFRNPSPFPVPAKLVLKVSAGQGNAAAQLYEK